jgi:hypothetical protein
VGESLPWGEGEAQVFGWWYGRSIG